MTSGFASGRGPISPGRSAGGSPAFFPSYSDEPLARVHYIIAFTPGAHPTPDLAALEAGVARIARTWTDDLEAQIRAGWPDTAPRRADPEPLWRGLSHRLSRPLRRGRGAARTSGQSRLWRATARSPSARSAARPTRRSSSASSSTGAATPRRRCRDVLPILSDMGLSALVEDGFPITPRKEDGHRETVWVHEFLMEDPDGERLSFAAMKAPFEEAFKAVWTGRAECDGLQPPGAGAGRVLARGGAGAGPGPLSPAVGPGSQPGGAGGGAVGARRCGPPDPGPVRRALRPGVGRHTGGPRGGRGRPEPSRSRRRCRRWRAWRHDRVLRRLAALVRRHHPHQLLSARRRGRDHSPTSASRWPAGSWPICRRPSPIGEIFVAGAARWRAFTCVSGRWRAGGLRWSDRRDDFRTEVLGLVKAQQVKNAVIVPVGSKGGFYPKALPRRRRRARGDVRAEAIARLQDLPEAACWTSRTTSTPTARWSIRRRS